MIGLKKSERIRPPSGSDRWSRLLRIFRNSSSKGQALAPKFENCDEEGALLSAWYQSIAERNETLLQEIEVAFDSRNLFGMDTGLYQIMVQSRALSILGRAPGDKGVQPAAGKKVLSYITGSYFLHACHTYLTQGKPEWLHYVTGVDFGEVLSLTQLVKVKLDKQSEIYASADSMDSKDILITMDEQYGHFLRGIFHSHRGRGKGASRPSSIDLNTQKRYEQGGYRVISAIFTEDGYIRFFTIDTQFEIQIFGKGVEKNGENLYCLTEIG